MITTMVRELPLCCENEFEKSHYGVSVSNANEEL